MPTTRERRAPADMAAALNDPKFLETLESRKIESTTLLKEDIDIKKMEGMETEFETLQKDMNTEVENFVRQEFGKKINEIRISSNSFTRLENALFDILPGTGRDYEEVKNFLVTTLETQLSSLADKKKQYLVNGILLNLKANDYRSKIR